MLYKRSWPPRSDSYSCLAEPQKLWYYYQIQHKPIVRPPVRKALCFTADVLFFFYLFCHAISELTRPIAAKLCHMIAIWVRFITQVQKFGRPSPQRNWGPKTCKIRRDFRRLQTSSANISGMGQDIQNRKSN